MRQGEPFYVCVHIPSQAHYRFFLRILIRTYNTQLEIKSVGKAHYFDAFSFLSMYLLLSFVGVQTKSHHSIVLLCLPFSWFLVCQSVSFSLSSKANEV